MTVLPLRTNAALAGKAISTVSANKLFASPSAVVSAVAVSTNVAVVAPSANTNTGLVVVSGAVLSTLTPVFTSLPGFKASV